MTGIREAGRPVDDRADVWRATARPTFAVTAVTVCAAVPPFLVGALAPLISDDLTFNAAQVGISIAAYYLVSGSSVAPRRASRRADRDHAGAASLLREHHRRPRGDRDRIRRPPPHDRARAARDPELGGPARCERGAGRSACSAAPGAGVRDRPGLDPTATLLAGLVLGVGSYVGGWRWTVLGCRLIHARGALADRRTDGDLRPRDDLASVPSRRSPFDEWTGWLLAVLVLAGFLASTAATSLPSYVASTGLDTGLSPAVVAGAQMLGSIACATTRIGAPLSVSRATARRRLTLIAALLTAGASGYVALGTGTSAGFLVGTLVAYAFGSGWNGLFNQVVVQRPSRPDRRLHGPDAGRRVPRRRGRTAHVRRRGP